MYKAAKYYFNTVGLRGLSCAIRAKASNSTLLLSIRRQDVKYPFFLRIPSSDVHTYQQIFLDREYEFVVEAQPKVIVDAGANIGLASIYFANRYPRARIVAIEPEETNFKLLKKNVAPYKTVIPGQYALWNHNGEINLIDPGRGKWGFMTDENTSSATSLYNHRHTVKAITVDRIIEEYELEKIDIFKIDIEGAEKEVFIDTSPWIEKVDAMIVELHERMKPGCKRSFYKGSIGFDNKWQQGENVYLSRGRCLTRRYT